MTLRLVNFNEMKTVECVAMSASNFRLVTELIRKTPVLKKNIGTHLRTKGASSSRSKARILMFHVQAAL